MNARSIALLIALFACGFCSRAASTLELGDSAPPIQLTEWLAGRPIDLSGDRLDKTVVLIFWETSCPSCIASLEELSAIEKAFAARGIVLVGVCAEPLLVLRPFVNSHRDQIQFRVASDDNRKSFDAYMTGSGKAIVPEAFVIDRNRRLLWRGHPLGGLQDALRLIINGKFDLTSAKRADSAEGSLLDYVDLAGTNQALAHPLGEKILQDAMSDAWVLNDFAWTILMSQKIQKRDYELARRAAEAAYSRSGTTNASIADTYARALYEIGSYDTAIRIQTRAVEFASGADQKSRMLERLKTFEAKGSAKN